MGSDGLNYTFSLCGNAADECSTADGEYSLIQWEDGRCRGVRLPPCALLSADSLSLLLVFLLSSVAVCCIG